MSLRTFANRGIAALSRELLGINGRNIRVVYRHNPREHFPLADDKILAKARLGAAGVPVPRTLATASSHRQLSHFLGALRDREDFVIKPANGSAGGGVVVIVARDGTRWRTAGGRTLDAAALRRHSSDILFGSFTLDVPDTALAEERLVPHPVLAEIFPHGLSDVRVITLLGIVAAAMLRVPTRTSGGRANLHQGAIGVGVDIRHGRTTRALLRGRRIGRHPDSGTPLAGVDVPCWDRVLSVAQRAASAVPLGYLGVDIGLDELRGPVVLEINKRPGLEIQNVNGAGLRPVLERIEAGAGGGPR